MDDDTLDVEEQVELFKKERLRNMTPEQRVEFERKQNERYIRDELYKETHYHNMTPEQKEKYKKRHQEWYKGRSAEQKKRDYQHHIEYIDRLTPEDMEEIKRIKRERWANRSAEEKEEYRKKKQQYDAEYNTRRIMKKYYKKLDAALNE